MLVMDNALCNSSVEEFMRDDGFAAAIISKLGLVRADAQSNRERVLGLNSAAKRFLARIKPAIKQVSPRSTIVKHRSRFLESAADLILREVVAKTFCRLCSRDTAPHLVMALDRLELPVGE